MKMYLNIALLVINGFLVGSLIKGIITIFKDKKITLKSFFRSGGMPSNHTSTLTSVMTNCLLIACYNMTVVEDMLACILAFMLISTIILIYDARDKTPRPRHTNAEVLAGSIVGIIAGAVYYFISH